MEQGYLILETGEIFSGFLTACHNEDVVGEVVFNTSMTGYQEIITDPSYAGQMVVFCYPLVGNYGVNRDENESEIPHVRGIITSELCEEPSHFKAEDSATGKIKLHGITSLTGVDTRELVRIIRKYGTVNGVITKNKNQKVPTIQKKRLVDQVSVDHKKVYENNGHHVVLVDYGYKKSILDYLLHHNCRVTLVPFNTTYEEIKKLNPDGVVFSNGPGDPQDLRDHLENIKRITEEYPSLGICLGHQLIAIAFGAKTKKLSYGHRGGNHPVKDLNTGKVFITSQNHGYVVLEESIDEHHFSIAFRHVNDGTVEGMKHKRLNISTVQFHPEAHPGPQDTEYIFEEFLQSLEKSSGVLTYAIK